MVISTAYKYTRVVKTCIVGQHDIKISFLKKREKLQSFEIKTVMVNVLKGVLNLNNLLKNGNFDFVTSNLERSYFFSFIRCSWFGSQFFLFFPWSNLQNAYLFNTHFYS
jgi:hypothetical protein